MVKTPELALNAFYFKHGNPYLKWKILFKNTDIHIAKLSAKLL